jgi:transcriptional regulator with XRE-family HTH domain
LFADKEGFNRLNVATTLDSVGDVLRAWRRRRKLSQLDLACEAGISTRHLSFVESGRAAPSRELLMRLAEPLALPLRERNVLLLAGGYAPLHAERTMESPDMALAKAAVERILDGHNPFPALAVDRYWNLVLANDAARAILANVGPALLSPPMNLLRASLHPAGLAPQIVNFAEWRHHLLTRLKEDASRSADPILISLHEELLALAGPRHLSATHHNANIAVPLTIRDLNSGAMLSFLSTTTVFGTAVDVTLAELTLECFYPADDATRLVLS